MLKTSRKRLLVMCLLALIGMGLGVWGGDVSFADQNESFRDLRNTAGIVFGVIGVWIALVIPKGLESIFRKDVIVDRGTYRQISHLLIPMRISMAVLVLALLFSWLGPLARASFEASHGWMRHVSFGVLGACTLLEGFAVIYAVAPAEVAGQHARIKHKNQQEVENMRSYGSRDPKEALRDRPAAQK